MKFIGTVGPLVGVIALTGLSGLASGVLSERWGPPAEAKLGAARLALLPEVLGDWEMESTVPVEADVIDMLECSGSLHRLYRNRTTGQVVNMVLLLGPSGPISAHTPDICYSSQAYTQVGATRRAELRWPDRASAIVWRLKIRSNRLEGERLSVAYSWNCGNGWVAPDWPRITFAGRPMLYKLQVVGEIDGERSDVASDPCESFLKAFLPECDATLFPDVDA